MDYVYDPLPMQLESLQFKKGKTNEENALLEGKLKNLDSFIPYKINIPVLDLSKVSIKYWSSATAWISCSHNESMKLFSRRWPKN